MRLYSQTNSHVGLYNDAIYSIDICCSDIFGANNPACIAQAQKVADNHTCTGKNKVIGLFSITNSHAERPYPDNSNVDVCYRNLECQAIDDSVNPDCAPGWQPVVRLYQETNSHAELGSLNNYPIKICCIDGTPDVYFADMNGQKIDEANIGDTVLMIYEGAHPSLPFVIYEEDDGFPDFIDDDIRTVSSTFIYGFDLAAEWYITRDDFEKGGNDDTETFYFEVDELESNRLTVSRNSQGATNELPVVKIQIPEYTLPKEQRRFKVNELVAYSGYAYDVDNPLNITWYLGDGKTKSCIWPKEEYICNPGFVAAEYSIPGTKPVYLRATELNREIPRTVSDYTEVYIYDSGLNVFPVISSPAKDSVFNFSEQPIRFNGSESYVSKCELGACPADKPSGVDCYVDPVWDLYCFDYPKTGTHGIGKTAGKYNLWFNWTFSDGDSVFGNWADNYINAVDFEKYFFKPQRYKVDLNVGYEFF